MTKPEFHKVQLNDLLLVGGRNRNKGGKILVRAIIGEYVRGIDKHLNVRLYHWRWLSMHHPFEKAV